MTRNLAVTALCLFLLLSLNASADPGFYSPNSKGIPKPVTLASEATYRFISIDPDGTTLPQKMYQQIIRKRELSLIHEINAQTVEKCIEKSLQECKITYLDTGSAFMISLDRTELLTVKHNVTNDLKRFQEELASERGQKIAIFLGDSEESYFRNIYLQFVLINSEGEIVFDTRNHGDYATPVTMGYGATINWKKDPLFGESGTDFIKIKLSRSVGKRSIKFSEREIGAKERVYVLGYPASTHTRNTIAAVPDSNGRELYCTVGNLVNIEASIQFFEGSDYHMEEGRKERLDKFLFNADLESTQGFSGGPMLNEQGEAIGILSESFDASSSAYYKNFSAIALKSSWFLPFIKL